MKIFAVLLTCFSLFQSSDSKADILFVTSENISATWIKVIGNTDGSFSFIEMKGSAPKAYIGGKKSFSAQEIQDEINFVQEKIAVNSERRRTAFGTGVVTGVIGGAVGGAVLAVRATKYREFQPVAALGGALGGMLVGSFSSVGIANWITAPSNRWELLLQMLDRRSIQKGSRSLIKVSSVENALNVLQRGLERN